jgi:hypothetical protein
MITELVRIMQKRNGWISPYRPQANGQTERANESLLNLLSIFSAYAYDDWDLYVPSPVFAYPTSVHPSLGETRKLFDLWKRPAASHRRPL